MYLFMVLATLCGVMEAAAADRVIPLMFSAFPWGTVEVNTTNYAQLPASYHEMKYAPKYEGYDYLPPYDMTELLVYTYLFTVMGGRGSVRITFQEYDLNPQSLLYIYDGGNVSAPGSVWTHNSPLPVYSSTGTQLFMVFKTGQDAENKHLGFVALVNFREEAVWLNPPMTGFCGPLTMTHDKVLLADIVYIEDKPDPSVYCSYTSHISSREMLVASTASVVEVYVRDFPSATVGEVILPFTRYKVTYGQRKRDVELMKFNLTAATSGFHMQLRPIFTRPLQKVIIILGDDDDDTLRMKLTLRALEEHDVSDWNCPYKKCAANGKCYDFRKPCWYKENLQLADGTCDLYDAQTDIYAQCGSRDHCYNTQTELIVVMDFMTAWMGRMNWAVHLS